MSLVRTEWHLHLLNNLDSVVAVVPDEQYESFQTMQREYRLVG